MTTMNNLEELSSKNSFIYLKKKKNICSRFSLFILYTALIYLIGYYFLFISKNNTL